MDIGVGMRDAIESLVEAECPQDGDISSERNAGFPELKSVEGVAIDACLGGDLGR